MKKIICIRAIVHGKVQGVFYRDSARQQAEALGITGWVKNNKDGSVELHACGEGAKIQLLIDWLHQGPERARVTKVDWNEIVLEEHEEFIILR